MKEFLACIVGYPFRIGVQSMGTMHAVLAPFTDLGEARDELMTYRFSKGEQFKTAVSLHLYRVGHSEQDVKTILKHYCIDTR